MSQNGSAHNTNWFSKRPADVLDYTLRWSDWLEAGDSIASSSWDIPDDLTGDDEVRTDSTTRVRISGGTPGQTYELINTITTTDEGLTKVQRIHLTIRR